MRALSIAALTLAVRVSAHSVVAAGIAFHPQPLEQARETEALAFEFGQFLGQQGV